MPEKRRHLPWVSIVAAGLAVLVFTRPEWTEALLMRFDRSWWLEPWRLFTCHGVHWSKHHLLWDPATLLLLGWLAERRSRVRLVFTLFAAAVCILAVVAATTDLESYAGLSGLDIAVYGLLATRLVIERWKDAPIMLRVIIVAGVVSLAIKLLYETLTGELWFVSATNAGFVPVPVAHLTGAIVGVICGTLPGSVAKDSVGPSQWAGTQFCRPPIVKTVRPHL